MNTLRKAKNLTLQSLIPSLLVIAGLAGINSSAQAACFGYPESTAGCTVNGTAGACVGKLAAGDIIVAGANYGGCTNPTTSPFANTSVCVIRGLGGNDLITASTTNYSNLLIVCSGGGNDVIQGGSNNDVFLGEAGQDIIIGGGGTNLVFGGSENDTLLLGGTGYGGANFNYGGTGTRDVCQAGQSGLNVIPECEVKLP